MAFNVGYTTTPTGFSVSPAASYPLVDGPYTMSQDGILQSVSIYLIGSVTGFVGIYDATGASGGPGNLIATSASTSLVSGWNTVNTTTTPLMTNGTVFWPAAMAISAVLPVESDSGTTNYYYGTSGNSFFPSAFGTINLGGASEAWGIYATFGPPYGGLLRSAVRATTQPRGIVPLYG